VTFAPLAARELAGAFHVAAAHARKRASAKRFEVPRLARERSLSYLRAL
jgi:hypothetical protein